MPPKPDKSPPKSAGLALPVAADKLGATARVKLALLKPSQTNARSDFNEDKIKELADSISRQGILNPLLVRPMKDGKHYEIIAGERRSLAAALLKLEDVPVRIGKLSDADALEIQTIENLQREGLSLVDEAVNLRQMLTLKGDDNKPRYTKDTVGDTIGKSQSWVYGRLKLLQAPKAALDAHQKGDLNASLLLRIARIPDVNDAKTATDTILRDGLSDRQAGEYIGENFMKRLKGQPFDQEDATLVPSAGACSQCPFRTGNMKVNDPTIKSADVCTKLSCLKAKVEATKVKTLNAAKKEGFTILNADRASGLWSRDWQAQMAAQEKDADAEVFAVNRYNEGGKYIDLDAQCPAVKGDKTWREVLEAKSRKPIPKGNIIMALDPADKPHFLATRTAVAAACKELGLEAPPDTSSMGGGTVSSEEQRKRQAAANRKAKLFINIRRAVAGDLVTKCAAAKSTPIEYWSILLSCAVGHAGHDTTHEVINRRAGKRIPGLDESDVMAKLLGTIKTEGDARALLLELLTIGKPQYQEYSSGTFESQFDDEYADACKLYNVSIKQHITAAETADKQRETKVVAKKAEKKQAKPATKKKK